MNQEKIDNKKSDMDTKVEIIIPTLNEANSIGKLLRDIHTIDLPIRISVLVIDGGSTDNTTEICKMEGVRIFRQKGKGKGNAMKEAVRYSDADVVVFIDGDGTYAINDLHSLLKPLLNDEADMVVGSRIVGDKEKGSISLLNSIGNKIFNRTINFSLKSHVTDSLSGYRALRREVFDDLILLSNSFEIEVEMTVEALAKGYRITEIPISYKNRTNSKTKLNPIQDGISIGRTLFFIIMNVRPLLFFGIISVIFFGISIYPASIVIYEKITYGDINHIPSVIFASLLLITGIIILVLGIISELIVRSRRRLEYLFRHHH